MKYSAILVGALAVLAQALPQLTNTDYSSIQEGKPFTIMWTNAVGAVTIKLKNGKSGDLKDVETITSGATGTSYVWTPESSLPSDTYAFEITDESGETNYSVQFTYVGSGTATPTASTASSTATVSTTKNSTSTSTESKSTTSSASLTSSTMHVSNSTTLATSTSGSTSSKGSSTASATSSSATSTSTGVPNTNNGQRIASSVALVLGAIAAFVAFN